jgi:hypothetical protein
MRTAAELCLEACELGDEAIKTAGRANTLALDDPQRWQLSHRMFAINRRLKAIAEEIQLNDEAQHESRSVS